MASPLDGLLSFLQGDQSMSPWGVSQAPQPMSPPQPVAPQPLLAQAPMQTAPSESTSPFGGDFGSRLQDLFQGLAMGTTPNESLSKAGMMMAFRGKEREQEQKARSQQNQTAKWLQGKGVDAGTASYLVSDPTALRAWFGQYQAGQKPDWQITEINDPATGRPVKAMVDKNTGAWNPIGGVKTDTLSSEAEGQKVRIAQAGRAQTNINIDQKGQSAWDKESAKLFAKRYDDVATKAQSASEMLWLYDLAAQGIDSGVRTGSFGSSEQAVRRFAQGLGIGDADRVAGGELLNSVTNRMALMMRNPDSGMGMPGAVSDRDLTFLKEAQVGLDRSPGGNRQMLEAFRKLEQRKIEVARMADDYVAEKGRLDAGFNKLVREYASANPLFNRGAKTQGAPAATPQPGIIEDGFRFKGGDPSKRENWERAL